MKNLWTNGWIALLAVLSLNGCTAKPAQTDSEKINTDLQEQTTVADTSKEDSIYQFPTEYLYAEGKVTFQTQLVIPLDGKLDRLVTGEALSLKINAENVFHQLFGNTEVLNEQIIDLDHDDGSKGTAYYYNGSQGESLSITDQSIYFHNNFLNYISNAFHLEEGSPDFNANLYMQDGNLSFATQEQALERILSQLSLLGINLDGNMEYTCYVLNYETLKQEESAMDVNGNQDQERYKDTWDETDNSYYFCIRQTQDGLPVTHEYADAFGHVEDGNAPIQAIISQNGIQMLTVDRVFQFSNADKKAELAEFDLIALSVKEKYEKLLTDSTYTVTHAKLYYLVEKNEGKYEGKPVWVFRITEQVNQSEQTYHQIIIDAETGMEIIL